MLNRRLSLMFPAALAVIALCGCESWPDKAEILVATSPPGASCLVSRSGQPVAEVALTPGIALVDPGSGEVVIQCRRPGFADATASLPPEAGRLRFGHPPLDFQRRVDIAMAPATGPRPLLLPRR